MKKKALPFTKAQFVASAFNQESFPKLMNASGNLVPEIALLGRSNVGKSSLINHLLRNSTLAKTSSAPGKTRSINFFMIDQQLALVDLPGYGYAKVSQAIKKEWSQMIDHYLNNRKSLALLLLLIDSRRLPNDEDIAVVKWARAYQKPLMLVFTKTDKRDKEAESNRKITLKMLEMESTNWVLYSVKNPNARTELIKKINEIVWD